MPALSRRASRRQLADAQQLRGQQQETEQRLEELRRRRDQVRAEFLSLEAVQQAALGEKESGVSAWLESFGQPLRTR